MNPRILVLYETTAGHSEQVATRIAAVLGDGGARATVARTGDAPPLEDYDAVLLGGSIHMGKYDRRLVDYAKAHAVALAARPGGFFTVCLMATVHDANHEATVDGYVDSFRQRTGWNPAVTAVFAGAIAYTRYDYLKRIVVKHIAATEGLSTDTHRDHDYTDWAAVDDFAREFLQYTRAHQQNEIPA